MATCGYFILEERHAGNQGTSAVREKSQILPHTCLHPNVQPFVNAILILFVTIIKYLRQFVLNKSFT